jgi:uncharacterized protein involved in exopolysaccharide biosynthesis
VTPPDTLPGTAPGVRPSPDDDPDAPGLGSLADWAGFVLRAPGRHRVVAALTFLSIAAAAPLAVSTIPHRYQVEATLLAQRSPVMGVVSNPTMNREWDVPARAAREAVMRRANLAALADQTHLVERYLAARAPAVRARDWLVERITRKPRDLGRLREDLIDTLAERLWVLVTPEGNVTFGFVWPDREYAAQLVGAALQGFLDERYASEIRSIGEAVAILQSHDAHVLGEIAATLDRIEAREHALGATADLRHPPTGPQPAAPRPRAPAPDEERIRLEGQLAARRRALADLETLRQQRLAELEVQLARERAIYAPNHPALMSTEQAVENFAQPSPEVGALRAEAQDLERQLAGHPGTSLDFAASAAAVQSDAALASVRLREVTDARLDYEKRRLEDSVRQHASLLERIDAASVEAETARAGFKYRYSVVSPPLIPKHPMRPYALLAVAGGLLGGLAMALLAAVALDVAGGRVLERWQLEEGLRLPVVGELPR